MVPLVLPLDHPAAERALVGGKGASLARLARAGLPVPPGFHVTTDACRAAWDDVEAAIRDAMPDHERPLAVRSSATTEDQTGASFAGQHDTVLGVVGVDAVLGAVRRCWDSLSTPRAVAYRARHDVADAAMAVVVQELVPADAAGVLFTANPVTGVRDELVVDAAWGLGEAVVGGQVTPDNYVIANGTVLRRTVADKAVRTVLADDGTRDEPVPDDRRRAPVLDDVQLGELATFGERIQRLYGMPMDVEWALHEGRFAILQARPLTGLPAVCNDSLTGDFLWTCTNLREAIPSVMTPVTWSLARQVGPPPLGEHAMTGNIGGRYYLNLSAAMTVATSLGLGGLMRRAADQMLGGLPDDVTIPTVAMSRRAALRAATGTMRSTVGAALRYQLTGGRVIAANPQRCALLRERIAETVTPQELRDLWTSDVDALLHETCRVLDAAARVASIGKIRATLLKLTTEADANALLSGLHTPDAPLASLGPVLGLAKLRAGEIGHADYADTWGHRCADEFELSAPRPAEDPGWLDTLGEVADDPRALLARQAKARDEAWQRLPRKAHRLRRRLRRAAAAARARERARSEFARTFWVFRAFVVRAGELTGHGEDLFFLPIDDVLTVLAGDKSPLATVAAQRSAYRRYRSLPPYPVLIRGRFDPDAWAAERAQPASDSVITGTPGVAGVVEGRARVVANVEDGATLEPGEILVTGVTNVGWTPLFPRAAAVVTDIGAPLSHAAIVARELGIPAVVGCGDATTRLHTGDRVRVDGAAGTVTILSRSAATTE